MYDCVTAWRSGRLGLLGSGIALYRADARISASIVSLMGLDGVSPLDVISNSAWSVFRAWRAILFRSCSFLASKTLVARSSKRCVSGYAAHHVLVVLCSVHARQDRAGRGTHAICASLSCLMRLSSSTFARRSRIAYECKAAVNDQRASPLVRDSEAAQQGPVHARVVGVWPMRPA